MNKTLLFFLFSALLISQKMQAQQLPLASEYLHNSFTSNPAMMGWENITALSASYRHQWTGMQNAPRTAALSYQQWSEPNNMAFGGFFMHDQTGPTSFTSVNLNYAYHIRMKGEKNGEWHRSRLSLGMSLSGNLYRLRGADLRYTDQDDNLIINANRSTFLPDVGFGMTYTNDIYYVGFSMPQLISMKTKFTSDDAISNLRRITHFYVNAGARFALKSNNKEVKQYIIPTLSFRYVPSAPLSFNATVRYLWNYKFSIGVGYSSDGSLTADVNANISKKFRIGYAFNSHVNGLAGQVGTTHEVMLTYVFNSSGKGWLFPQTTAKTPKE